MKQLSPEKQELKEQLIKQGAMKEPEAELVLRMVTDLEQMAHTIITLDDRLSKLIQLFKATKKEQSNEQNDG